MQALIYVSRSLVPFDRPALDLLADQSAEANRARAITGHLHYREERFLQYLEGSAEPLAALMGRIRADPRHEVLLELPLGSHPGRRFPSWAMRILEDDLVRRVGFEDAIARTLLRRTAEGAPAEELVATAIRLADDLAEVVGRSG